MFCTPSIPFPRLPPSPLVVRPGALQVRGDNLMGILEGLTRAPELRTREERRQRAWREGGAGKDKGAEEGGDVIWFDLFMRTTVSVVTTGVDGKWVLSAASSDALEQRAHMCM